MGQTKALNEKGIALIMTLILSAIALAIMAALVYMLTASSQVSGIQKRYRTALDAAKGGADATYRIIGFRGSDPGLALALTAFNIPSGPCLNTKLNNPTLSWGACDSSISINPQTPSTYDMYFQLGTTTQYNVYSKIVSTVVGNSGPDLGLSKPGVVLSNSGEIPVQPVPYLYTIEVEADSSATLERGKYSILYAY